MENILTFGLSQAQLALLEAALPEGYSLQQADCITDLIVGDGVLTIIQPGNTDASLCHPLHCYYLDTKDALPTTVVWIGEPLLPRIYHCADSILDLLIDLPAILGQAQEKYRQQKGYTDIYSFLPKHAISEAIEEDVYAALDRKYGNQPPKALQDQLRQEWSRLQAVNGGPETLAAVYELTRWLRREHISYQTDGDARYGLIPRLLDITDTPATELPVGKFRGNNYILHFPREATDTVNHWLCGHWYFGRHQCPSVRLSPAPKEALPEESTCQQLSLPLNEKGETQ